MGGGTKPAPGAAAAPEMDLKKFLESVPPGRWVKVKNLARQTTRFGATNLEATLQALELFCPAESRDGIRFFAPTDSLDWLKSQVLRETFVEFRCRNCQGSRKTFALWLLLGKDGEKGEVFKLGEVPAFGPPTPARLISLIGPEKDYYLKGRHAENQGLGIGAFVYYRRVVENQKDRIFDDILKVSEKIGAPKELLAQLTAAKAETQFSKAVETIKQAIPQALLINGHHNPLMLLHSALSEGLHDKTDDQCLELATSIRVVLTELVERMANALQGKAELNAAVGKLFKGNVPKPQDSNNGG